MLTRLLVTPPARAGWIVPPPLPPALTTPPRHPSSCRLICSMSQVFDASEVKKHNTPESVWVVIDGQIFDVTSFLDDVRVLCPLPPAPCR